MRREKRTPAILDRTPGHRVALPGLIALGLSTRDVDMVRAAVQDGLARRHGDPVLRVRVIVVERRIGRQNAALDLARRLTAEQPCNWMARLELAEQCAAAELTAEAEGHFAGVLEAEPGNSKPRVGLARLLDAGGRREAAVQLLAEGFGHKGGRTAPGKGRCNACCWSNSSICRPGMAGTRMWIPPPGSLNPWSR